MQTHIKVKELVWSAFIFKKKLNCSSLLCCHVQWSQDIDQYACKHSQIYTLSHIMRSQQFDTKCGWHMGRNKTYLMYLHSSIQDGLKNTPAVAANQYVSRARCFQRSLYFRSFLWILAQELIDILLLFNWFL